MSPWRGLAAGLLVGAIPVATQAQETDPPTASSRPPPQGSSPPPSTSEQAPPKGAPPAEVEFTDQNGDPLPAERQRELRAQFKQEPPPPQTRKVAGTAGTGDIVVNGQRPRGSVLGDIPPAQTLNPLDIRAYGANDIGELLETLRPQVSSNRGRTDDGPVVLLNGKRVSSFTEIARIPAEAIERMEVFPEELALKYGYRADQKVVNIITYERFNSRIGQVSYGMLTEGGRDTLGLSANILRISGDTRVNLDAERGRSGALLESERGVLQSAGDVELGRFRTLLPGTRRTAVNGTVSGEWISGVSSTLNARFEANRSESLLGRGPNGALRRDFDTQVAHLGTSLGGQWRKWSWSFTANYDRTSTLTLTDASIASGGRDRARSLDALANADLLLSGSLLKLPAGPITASFEVGAETRDFSSRSSQVAEPTALSRDQVNLQASVDVPIFGGRVNAAAWPGSLSANVNLAAERLSGVGTLRTLGYGLNWSPVGGINVIASATQEEGAPTVDQLGAPQVITPNVPTFDFARGEVSDITRLFGGNPGLRSDDRSVFKLGMNAKPFAKTDLTLSMDLVRTRVENPIASFPIATPQVEAAFPDRFTRDASGRLTAIDSRPVNFQRSDQDQLRLGINFTRPLGPVPPGMRNAKTVFVGNGGDLQKALPPGARIIKPEPGSPAARRFENASSRLSVSVYYTLGLRDRILTRDGGPSLDLLNGTALEGRGGRARHQVEFQAAAFKRGLGVRVKASWQSGTLVRGLPDATADSAGDLTFAPYATVNVNLFANLADWLGTAGGDRWLKGMRASFGVTNLFNSRLQVRGPDGSTPLSYQAPYLDPLGRQLTFSLRKLF
jgi:hypothetical protein